MKLGELLKSKRKERNLTLKQVARLIGVSESLISRYESGENEPSFMNGLALMNILEIDFSDMIQYAENKKEQLLFRYHKDEIIKKNIGLLRKR